MKQGISGREQYNNYVKEQQEKQNLLAEETTFDSIDGLPPAPNLAANPNYQEFNLPTQN